MNEHAFFERVSRRCGLEEGPELERMVKGTLRALGEALSMDETARLREELPPRLAEALEDVEHGQARELEAVLMRISSRTGARLGVALEQLAVVAEVLVELVRPEVMAPVRRALPWRLGRLFLPAPLALAPPVVHHDATHHTLAEARASSSRPLYAAQPQRAQSESVARSDNPHGETKLSSARGLTQEREDETLAAAHASEDDLALARH